MCLLDDTAIDVSRITGIPWCWRRVESRGPEHPYLDLVALDAWDRFRVAWALICGYYFLDYHSN